MSQIDVDVIALGRVARRGPRLAAVRPRARRGAGDLRHLGALRGRRAAPRRAHHHGGRPRRRAPARAARLAVPDDASRRSSPSAYGARSPTASWWRASGRSPTRSRSCTATPSARRVDREALARVVVARRGAGRPGGRCGRAPLGPRRRPRRPGRGAARRRSGRAPRGAAPGDAGQRRPTTSGSWKRSPDRSDEPSRDVEVLREGDLEVGRTRGHGRDGDVGVPLDAGRPCRSR